MSCPVCGQTNDKEPLLLWGQPAEYWLKLRADNARMKAALEWISVDERLPEDLHPIIVKGTSENPNREGYDICWLNNGDWTSWFVKDITHWREIE